MALYVLKDGCEFEQMIMMEHQGRPEFEFLFDLESDLHAYYRWRLYSLAGRGICKVYGMQHAGRSACLVQMAGCTHRQVFVGKVDE